MARNTSTHLEDSQRHSTRPYLHYKQLHTVHTFCPTTAKHSLTNSQTLSSPYQTQRPTNALLATLDSFVKIPLHPLITVRGQQNPQMVNLNITPHMRTTYSTRTTNNS